MLNDADYKKFVRDAYDGHILVGVDRVFARKLYTDLATSAIECATGEAPHLEKLVVWFAFIASPVAFLASAALMVPAFRRWAFLLVPAALLSWICNRMMAVRGGSRIWLLSLVLIVAVSAHFAQLLPNSWISGSVTTLAFAMWCDRLLYGASPVFLRAFVLRNQRALEAFSEGLTIREAR